MEMDYNWMASNAPQSFQYMSAFAGGDASVMGAVSDGPVASMTSLENPLDNTAFLSDNFHYTFDPSLNSASTGLTPMQPSQSPSPGHYSSLPGDARNVDFDATTSSNNNSGDLQRRRSSSAEKDVTPAQSRRKAQNRAAQRAFRERKERHVRDLEAKLNLLTTTTSSLQSDNERLKLMLQRAQTENEILRASAAARSSTPPQHAPGFVDDPSILSTSHQAKTAEPMPNYDATRLASGLISSTRSTSSGRGGSPSESDSHLLSASATWDLLQSHPLYLSGAVDIGEVCERLKKMARCEGMGPMFDEEEVRKVIEEVGRSGHDELI